MKLTRLALAFAVVAGVAGSGVGCVRANLRDADAMSPIPREPLGQDRLALKWKFQTADRRTELGPQEFASSALGPYDSVFVGSAAGEFFALRAADGSVRWRKTIGAVGSAPLVLGNMVLVGTVTGVMIALDSLTGAEKWRYQSRGPIEQTAVATTGDLVIFSNEADQVVALDAQNGKLHWQYKAETPDEYTLRGHAGVAVDGDLVYTGFANGTMVALRRDTGSIAWSTSLKGDAERFMDVDATPIVIDDRVYVSSSSGGVFSLDKGTGVVRWRVPFYDASLPSAQGNVGGLATDGKMLFVSVADLGLYALDMEGNIVWRVGARGGGEPGTPVVFDDLLLVSLAEDGLFLTERKTGRVVEYFDPGSGASAQPTLTGDGRLFVMSNRGVLYDFDID
jgi:outer membrane protein assembly factor BamB|nr:PQQ-binding-like beta-propeller repeat protein [Kofleriaceae bacterium]